MSGTNRDRASLWDMVQAIDEIQEATDSLSYEQFEQRRIIRRAVERNFEILGEAATRVSDSLRTQYPDIDWRRIIGLRNIIIYRYDTVDPETLWTVVTDNLDELKQQLGTLLHSM
ncbi:MAG: DUF86 domain-containing protein [Geitlerinemataceae cyanobacterium]